MPHAALRARRLADPRGSWNARRTDGQGGAWRRRSAGNAPHARNRQCQHQRSCAARCVRCTCCRLAASDSCHVTGSCRQHGGRPAAPRVGDCQLGIPRNGHALLELTGLRHIVLAGRMCWALHACSAAVPLGRSRVSWCAGLSVLHGGCSGTECVRLARLWLASYVELVYAVTDAGRPQHVQLSRTAQTKRCRAASQEQPPGLPPYARSARALAAATED